MDELTQGIITAAGIIGGVTTIAAFLFKLVSWAKKPAEQDKAIKRLHDKHEADMKALHEEDAKRHAETQAELQILCYGLRGALQGLIETGCNGPCKDALKMLDKHLNKSAHEV